MRKSLLVLIAASTVLSVTACAGRDHRESLPADFPTVQPQTFLLKLDDDLRDRKTLTFTSVERVEEGRVVGGGVVRYREGGPDLLLELTLYPRDGGPSSTSRVIRVDWTVYVDYDLPGYNIPERKQWLKITKEAIESGKLDDLAFPGDPTAMLRTVAAAPDLRFIGTERRSDQTLARYVASVDLEQAVIAVSDEFRGYVQYLVDAGASTLDFVISVNREGTLYHYEAKIPAVGTTSDFYVTAWGAPAAIDTPDDELVATLQEARNQ
jgi:hypothetical protein